MGSFFGRINFLKFRNSCLISVKGRTGTKRGIFIPIDDNNIFVSADEDLKPRGAYVDFTAFENRQPGKYGDTHSMRQSLAKEVRERMSEEELKSVPYIGNMKPCTAENAAHTAEAPAMETDGGYDDLPF